MAWGVGGWLLFPFLQKLGAEKAAKLRERVVAELKTTFASHYSHVVSLAGGAANPKHPSLQPTRHGREVSDRAA